MLLYRKKPEQISFIYYGTWKSAVTTKILFSGNFGQTHINYGLVNGGYYFYSVMWECGIEITSVICSYNHMEAGGTFGNQTNLGPSSDSTIS